MAVRVYNTHWLQFQVNHTIGVLDVREARSALVSGLEKRIAALKTILGETPQRLLEQIYALKKQVSGNELLGRRNAVANPGTTVRPGGARGEAGICRNQATSLFEGSVTRR
jgi:hypothetical protein